eukprot:5512070-Ditylum_brightwellii.AAC.1
MFGEKITDVKGHKTGTLICIRIPFAKWPSLFAVDADQIAAFSPDALGITLRTNGIGEQTLVVFIVEAKVVESLLLVLPVGKSLVDGQLILVHVGALSVAA